MPIIKSAKKRMRQDRIRRMRNRGRRSQLRTALQKAAQAIDSDDRSTLDESLREAQSLLDRSASLGVIHRNRAARTLSRLARRVQASIST